MKKTNIVVLLGIFVVGITFGVLGTMLIMDGEEQKAPSPRPRPTKEKAKVPPIDETAMPTVEEKEGFPLVNEVTVPPVEVEQKSPVQVLEKPIAVENLSDSCKGPFGFDSQKILNEPPIINRLTLSCSMEYMIAIVSDVNLEKNNDGTWYVYSCNLLGYPGLTVFFTSPNPQQNDLKEGNFIGITGEFPYSQDMMITRTRPWTVTAKILDHISSQSLNCKIDDISVLSTPTGRIEDIGYVTGVIMAVQIKKNRNPEPDNPDDYQIVKAAMKCADGKLYMVHFELHKGILDGAVGFSGDPVSNVNLPSHDAFGEGDVVTVTQTTPTRIVAPIFEAYYKEK